MKQEIKTQSGQSEAGVIHRNIDWLAFSVATGLSLDEMDALAERAGINMGNAFITAEQAERFNDACLEAGLARWK